MKMCFFFSHINVLFKDIFNFPSEIYMNSFNTTKNSIIGFLRFMPPKKYCSESIITTFSKLYIPSDQMTATYCWTCSYTYI